MFFVIVSVGFLALEVSPLVSVPPIPRGPYGAMMDPCGIRATWAVGQPFVVRYVVYVANIFRGEWGASFSTSCEPVLGLVLGHAADTLILTFGALALSGLVARAVGPALARRHGRVVDALGSAAALASTALPAAGLALAFLLGLMATGPGFSPVGDHSPDYASMSTLLQVADYLAHLLVPFLAVVALSLGYLILAVRSASLWEQDRRGPRLVLESLAGGPAAPGEKRSAVPALLPELAVYIGWTMSASLLVEIVFGLDGLGTLLERTASWDPFAVNGVFLFLSLLLVVALAATGLIGAGGAPPWLSAEPPVRAEAKSLGESLRRFFLRRATFVGIALLGLLVTLSLAAPLLVGGYTPYAEGRRLLEPPSPAHPLGTGVDGVDILATVIAGGTVPLLIAATSFGLALLAGVFVAVATGILGGRTDRVVASFIAALLCLPWLPLVGLVGLPQGLPAFLLLAALSWPIPAATLRRDIVEFLQNRGFPEAAAAPPHASGNVPAPRLWTRGTARFLASVSPLIGSSALVTASLSVLVLSGTAFIFYDVPIAGGSFPTWPGWQTSLVVNWLDGMRTGAWFSMLPFVIALFATSLTFAVLGFSLREASLPLPQPRPSSHDETIARGTPSAVRHG